ncbi:MAG: hypothetical protein Q7U54_17910 [Bacteroidales bacterium]|nr:hypothetical protein [Bacteroidales bacterium]
MLTGKELDANKINEVINSTLKNSSDVISQKYPVVLFAKVASETGLLTGRFCCIINKADSVKSEAMLKLNAAFNDRNIGFDYSKAIIRFTNTSCILNNVMFLKV